MPAAPGANGRICLRLKRRKQTLFFDVRPSDTIRSVATRIALIHNPNSAEEVVPRDASEVSICAIKDKNKLWGEGNAIAGLEIEADRTIEAINAAEYDVLLYRLWQRPEGTHSVPLDRPSTKQR